MRCFKGMLGIIYMYVVLGHAKHFDIFWHTCSLTPEWHLNSHPSKLLIGPSVDVQRKGGTRNGSRHVLARTKLVHGHIMYVKLCIIYIYIYTHRFALEWWTSSKTLVSHHGFLAVPGTAPSLWPPGSIGRPEGQRRTAPGFFRHHGPRDGRIDVENGLHQRGKGAAKGC
jgi:hypothetical protein